MQLYFIRHAQSSNNLLWDTTGSSTGRSEDPQLTDRGKKQAKLLADFLAEKKLEGPPAERDYQNSCGFPLTHLYSSLMVRSVQTGLEVARATGLQLTAWLDLHEGGGIYLDDEISGERIGQPGNTRAYFQENYPDLLLTPDIGEWGWWNRHYETPEECSLRAKRVLDELLERHGGTDDRVAWISHGGFYGLFLRQLTKTPVETNLWFTMNNCGITRIDFDDEEIQIVYANRLEYITADLIT